MNRPLNILVAEDNPDDLFLLRHAFQKAGCTGHLYSVNDGAEAVAYLEGKDSFSDRTTHPFPDVLLLDLNMPRMNGFEVLDWVGQNGYGHRLLVHVLTASSRQADIQRAYELHANSYVVKPSRLDELVGFVKALRNWHEFISAPSQAGLNGT